MDKGGKPEKKDGAAKSRATQHAVHTQTQEQLKDPQRHFRRPKEPVEGSYIAPGQLLAWKVDFKVSSPLIPAFEQLMLWLATVHSSLIAH